jgi:hypothetical protein
VALSAQGRGKLLDLRHLIRPGYKSVAGKLGPFRAVKTGLGECPKKGGFPVKLELGQSHHQSHNTIQSVGRSQ